MNRIVQNYPALGTDSGFGKAARRCLPPNISQSHVLLYSLRIGDDLEPIWKMNEE